MQVHQQQGIVQLWPSETVLTPPFFHLCLWTCRVKVPMYEFYWLVKMLRSSGAMLTLKGWIDHHSEETTNPIKKYVLRGLSHFV